MVGEARGPPRLRGPRAINGAALPVSMLDVGVACLERLLVVYRGGNCDRGRVGCRAAVGAVAVYPMTAQLMSTPTEP